MYHKNSFLIKSMLFIKDFKLFIHFENVSHIWLVMYSILSFLVLSIKSYFTLWEILTGKC